MVNIKWDICDTISKTDKTDTHSKFCIVVFVLQVIKYVVINLSRGMHHSVPNLCDHMGVSYTNAPLWKY